MELTREYPIRDSTSSNGRSTKLSETKAKVKVYNLQLFS